MSGVMMHLAFDRKWILAAIPDAVITTIRLQATEPTLLARLDRRETGSGREAQMERSLRQARRMAEKTDGVIVVQTDGKTPRELAGAVLREVGWLA